MNRKEMTKKEMMDIVINRFGHEDLWVIWFCSVVEKLCDWEVMAAFSAVLELAPFGSE